MLRAYRCTLRKSSRPTRFSLNPFLSLFFMTFRGCTSPSLPQPFGHFPLCLDVCVFRQSTENHATPLLSGAVTRSTTEGVVALPTLDPETSTSGVGAAAAASPVMRAATLPGLGAGGGGGGGHEGLKGVPAGHSFRSLCWELPRRPGIGCGGTVAGRCAGWARGGGIDSFLNRSL